MSIESKNIFLGLPKGRMQKGVFALLEDAGVNVRISARAYRPTLSLPGIQAKILKPQDIITMLHYGKRDIGFAGKDWVAELGADVVDLLDTEMDKVSLVAAAPVSIIKNGKLPNRPLLIASEYVQITNKWIKDSGLNAECIPCRGATEVFPPEDADCIVDNTSTGQTLRANDLEITDTILTSSTRLYANPKIMDIPEKRERVEQLVTLLKSVLDAKKRVMLEVNVDKEHLVNLIAVLPCMQDPTVSQLSHDAGYAVKSAVKRSELPDAIPKILEAGGRDLVISNISQLIA